MKDIMFRLASNNGVQSGVPRAWGDWENGLMEYLQQRRDKIGANRIEAQRAKKIERF